MWTDRVRVAQESLLLLTCHFLPAEPSTLTDCWPLVAAAVQVSFWLAGTAVGGSLGLLSMAFAPFADNPYGQMAVLCAFCFLVGQLGQSQFRVVVTLTLITYGALVLVSPA